MPRITSLDHDRDVALEQASMRPGRNAPDNRRAAAAWAPARGRFNEAGAKCPG